MDTSFLEQDLKNLQSNNLYRSLRQVSSPQAKEIILNGKKVLNFCSNNYLGLADDERIKQAAAESISQNGFGSGASRLVSGTMDQHLALETKLALLKNAESALVFSSGYMANIGIIPAVVGREDVVLSDKYNHASIVDGVLLSRAEFHRYNHNDMNSLEEALKRSGDFRRRLIITDSVFSMDGDTANLKEIVNLARCYEAIVMVDEAHGFGVLGDNGTGLVEQEGLNAQVDIQMGTLSKAAGCFGAYVCGSKLLREYLINYSRSFIYTTAMPPSLAAAASVAVDIIEKEQNRRNKLLANAKYLREGIQQLGFDTLQSSTPIIPIVLKDAAKVLEASKRLLEEGIFVQAIRPPTVPVNTARLRVTVMATHTQEDLDRFINAMINIK